MYNAYAIEEVVSKLPIEATSITNHPDKDNLLIGSKQGHLLCCTHSHSTHGSTHGSYDYQLCRTFEKFSITKLLVVTSETNDYVICLSEQQCLTVHEAIEPYKLIGLITKSKPIFDFACQQAQNNFYILVSTKNRMILYRWLANDAKEIASINVMDTAQQLLWCKFNSLFIAIKYEYQFVKLTFNDDDDFSKIIIDQPITILTHGTQTNENLSLLVDLADKSLVGLCRDCIMVDFFDMSSGRFADDVNSCKFTDSLIALVYDSPYLVGILKSNSIEIRSVLPSMLVQKISLQRISLLSVGKRGCIYVANDTQAWKMNALIRLKENINFLKNAKQFELALQLAEAHKSMVDSNQRIDIKKQLASKYFNQRKFTKCFDIHAELDTELLFLISFIPELVPEKYQSKGHIQDASCDYLTESIQENDKQCAIQALMQHLSMKRIEHARPIKLHYLDFKDGRKEHILTINELKRHETSLELIDTVLLKCYLNVNPKLVAPLLRIKNCCCIISEAEKDLKKHNMLEELLILYKRKNMFRKYLELLHKEIKKTERNSKFGIDRMANFLYSLNNYQLPLILEFAPIVLSENLKSGLEIFTGKDAENKNFDRDEILQFLKRECVPAIIPYLEHIIYQWNDERPLYHEELLHYYILRVRDLLVQYVKLLTIKQSYVTTDNLANDELLTIRKKLQKFLETDQFYTIKNALDILKTDKDLIEEKAILYGRLGEHTKALDIYTNVLMDFEAAEHHCQIYYNEKNLKTAEVFFDLFHFYITGTLGHYNTHQQQTEMDSDSQNYTREIYDKRQPNITEALKLLRRHPTKINIVSAFALIPLSIPLSKLCIALKAVFEALNNRLTLINLMFSLTNITIKRTEKNLDVLKQQRIHINQGVECFLCSKRIMESAFVRHCDKSISHYYCYKANHEQKKIIVDSQKIN